MLMEPTCAPQLRDAIADTALYVGDRGKQLRATVPLSEMIGYATHLRSLTQGRASLSMQLQGFAPVSESQQEAIVRAYRGY